MFSDITQWIKVDALALRSINIERDGSNTDILNDFQVTPMVLHLLSRLADGMEGEGVQAWSLTGPYGTGKSSFCVFLLFLLSGEDAARKTCLEKIQALDGVLAKRLEKEFFTESPEKTAFTVRGVSQYEPLNRTLCRSLAKAIEGEVNRSSKLRRTGKKALALMEREDIPTGELMGIFDDLAAERGGKIFIVIDELGKNLEYQAHNPTKGDIFALQMLAERENFFIWTCLHQAFGVYSRTISRLQREEWQKIQGRFEDVSYVDSPTRSLSLVRNSLSVSIPKTVCPQVKKWACFVKKSLSSLPVRDIAFLSQEDILSLYPLHPLAVFLLGELVRRFGQNDRTIFSFLSSGEVHGFPAWLTKVSRTSASEPYAPMLGLWDLYDYFCQRESLSSTSRAENQRWIEIHSIISQLRDGSEMEKKILKTVGVLNLLSDVPGVGGYPEFIQAALEAEYYGIKDEMIGELKSLIDKNVLLYREYSREYRLWEGTDCDLDGELVEAKGRIALRGITEILEDLMPQAPFVAARHSYQSGTLREFAVKWCVEDEMEKISAFRKKGKGQDGVLWLLLGRGPVEEVFKKIPPTEEAVLEVFGYSPSLEQLRQLIIHAAASKELCSLPQLQRDGIARREAAFRASQAGQELESFLERVFLPGSSGVDWYFEGQKKDIGDHRALSSLLSDLCDRAFKSSPFINNEMINVDKLSSAAVAARNRVVTALANNPLLENLGFQGCGPEVALYRSLIRETGLHREGESGGWYLSAPDVDREPRLACIWSFIDSALSESDRSEELLPVSVIVKAIRKAPFGMRNGPILLYIVHYLLVRSDEVAVYEDGVFKPFFGDAEATLLMRRPELFELRSYRINALRSEVVRTYAQVINMDVDLLDNLRNRSILSVVVPLTEFVRVLPQYTLRTRSLSPEALRLRNAISSAKDPQRLLFHEIPKALDITSLSDGISFCRLFAEAMDELNTAFDRFSSRVLSIFLEIFKKDFPDATTLEILRKALRLEAERLLPVCMDGELRPLLSLFASERGTDVSWLLQVVALIMKRPLASWQDSDLDPFAFRAKERWERIRRLSSLKDAVEKREGGPLFTVVFPDNCLWEPRQSDSKEVESRAQDFLKNPDSLGREEREILLSWLLKKIYLEGVSS